MFTESYFKLVSRWWTTWKYTFHRRTVCFEAPRDAIKFLAWLKLLVWKWEKFCQMIKLLELFTSAGNIQLSEQQNLSPDVSVVELNARAY